MTATACELRADLEIAEEGRVSFEITQMERT